MKKLSVALLTIIACCMLWACGKTATFNESEEETTTHKKNKTEYSTTAEDITESSERQTYSDSDYKTGITFDNISRNPKDYEGKLVYFTGEVVQLMEGDDENQIRLAVDGDYDKVILIGYDPEITTSRILEDDNIEIKIWKLAPITIENSSKDADGKIKTILPYAFHLIKPVKNLTEFQVFLYLLT